MPYADPKKRIASAKNWREKKMKEGYGKALYARRAARYKNEEILRAALLEIDSMVAAGTSPGTILSTIEKALSAAPEVGPPIDYMP